MQTQGVRKTRYNSYYITLVVVVIIISQSKIIINHYKIIILQFNKCSTDVCVLFVCETLAWSSHAVGSYTILCYVWIIVLVCDVCQPLLKCGKCC